jgi:hypothetical protein
LASRFEKFEVVKEERGGTLLDNSCHNAGGQGDALARQRLGDDWKNATLSELREFLRAHNVKE